MQTYREMREISESFAQQMQSRINAIAFKDQDTIRFAEEAVKIVLYFFDKLKAEVKLKSFNSKEEEIKFFKEIKPIFSSKLIFYNEVYRIETAKPLANQKAILKYYNREVKRLNKFYFSNCEFYKYYQSQSTYLDKKFFVRRKHDIKTTIDSHFFQSDFDFNTSHDFLVARIMANELLQNYLENNIKEIQQKQEERYQVQNNGNAVEMKWTGSKVALIELLYALHTSEVINNGNITLSKIVQMAEEIFSIKLNQFNRVYLEIKNRKAIEQTAFLNQLKDNLLKRIYDTDK